MKVGLLNSGAARLGAYWAAFLRELEVEVVPGAITDAEALEIGGQSLPGESPVVQLALGRILALGRVDVVLVPQWPAVSGDAWNEAFTDLLPRRISGLPTLIPVPDTGEQVEAVATEVGLRLTRNAGLVRRALERARILLNRNKGEMPALNRASQVTVAVIGPRALLGEDVLSSGLRQALEGLGLHAVYGPDLPLAETLQRAERLENAAKLPAGERELFGSASLLAGKSAVKGLIFALPLHDGATRAALTRIAGRLHKPTLLLNVAGGQTDFPELAAFRDQVTLGVAAAEGDA
ncbi:hypothetical protein D3875_10385 [Deinococcus cavernae]|uniref:Uncharacterized protein n=1 Tax=Deinococcus cavernae TaxID=2320857 RepID=A0A418V766_9DEIO|nr:hypothetical protein [Deinococcus cavernae]RJF71910.1 hypothetical protein D3875_10385 [Deinococcus cavernae]